MICHLTTSITVILIYFLILKKSFFLHQSIGTEAADTTKIDTRLYKKLCVTETRSYDEVKDNDMRGHAILRLGFEVTSYASLLTQESPQNKALCWLLYDDLRKTDPRGMWKRYSRERFLDRYALVTLYMNTEGPQWIRSDNWLSKKSECLWYGVRCGRMGLLLMSERVLEVDLSFNSLSGIIPREIAYLSELRDLDMNGNSLQGVIPHLMFTKMSKLTTLYLHMNDLFGRIPNELGQLSNLRELSLYGNFFIGTIPYEISLLKNLRILDMYANNLSGGIPSSVGSLKKLRELHLNDNQLTGTMPRNVCALKLHVLTSDCLDVDYIPEVICDCCTLCCQGLPDPKCRDMQNSEGKIKEENIDKGLKSRDKSDQKSKKPYNKKQVILLT